MTVRKAVKTAVVAYVLFWASAAFVGHASKIQV